MNDIAIATLRILSQGKAERILIVDCDVHQGDGTAAIFANDHRVFTFSVHCQANFPVRKQVIWRTESQPGELMVDLLFSLSLPTMPWPNT